MKPLYKALKVLILEKQLFCNNVLFVYDTFTHKNPPIFDDFFEKSNQNHNYRTRGAHKDQLNVYHVNTQNFGIHSTRYKMIKDWNKFINDNFINSTPLDKNRKEIINILYTYPTGLIVSIFYNSLELQISLNYCCYCLFLQLDFLA